MSDPFTSDEPEQVVAAATSGIGPGESLVRGLLAALARGDVAAFDEFIAPDYVASFAGAPEPVRGRERYKELAALFLAAFPDLHASVHDLFERGDRVAARLTYHGTHQGEYQGIAPTGKTVAFDSIEIGRIAGRQLVEEWVSFDELSLLRQIGGIAPSS